MSTEPASGRRPGCGCQPWLPAACLLLAASLQPALAQPAPGGAPEATFTIEEIAFDAADTDNDGLVSLPELARDAAHGFATLDKDGSGTLTPAELGPHDSVLFERVDVNKDGVLTFQEVMINKERAFKKGDTNHDGYLSFEEMSAVVELETGKMP